MKVVIVAANSRSLLANRGHLIRAWVSAGHEVHALVPERDLDRQHLDSLGIPYVAVPLNRHELSLVHNAYVIRGLGRDLKRLSPDVIFSYTLRVSMLTSLAARSLPAVPVTSLVTGLGTGGNVLVAGGLKGRVIRAMIRFAFGRSDVVAFQNTSDLEVFNRFQLIDQRRTQAAVVAGSGVDVSRYSPARRGAGPPVFVMLSRLLVDKGVREFAEVAVRVRKHRPDVRFFLAGSYDPSLRGSISPQELEPGVNGDRGVEYVGFIPDVRQILGSATALVLPTYYHEGLPRSILEAMAMARPVIATDWPGCRDAVIDGKTGLLVRPRDVSSLEDAVLRLADDSVLAERLGCAGRQDAESRFDVRLVNRRMSELVGVSIDDV